MVQLGAPACQQIQLPKAQMMRAHSELATPVLVALLLTL